MIYNKVRSVLEKYSKGMTVTPDLNLTNDLGLDSIDRAEIGVELEDSLGMKEGVILQEDMMECQTVRDLVVMLESVKKYSEFNAKQHVPSVPKYNFSRLQPNGTRICVHTGNICNKVTYLRAVDTNPDFCNIVKCQALQSYLQKSK